MESKITATAQKEEAPEKEAPEASDMPLLGLSDAAVKKLIRSAKKRGYETHDQINSVSPSEEVNSEHIEEETDPDEDNQRKEPEEKEESEGGEIIEVQRPAPVKVEKSEPLERTDDPVGMYLRDEIDRAAFSCWRDRDRQAHRGRPRHDDRGVVREPAH